MLQRPGCGRCASARTQASRPGLANFKLDLSLAVRMRDGDGCWSCRGPQRCILDEEDGTLFLACFSRGLSGEPVDLGNQLTTTTQF